MSLPLEVAVGTLLEPRPELPDFSVEILAGRRGLNRPIRSPHVQKTGLALAGFHEYIRAGRVLVFGESEVRFLESRSPDQRTALAARLLEHDIPCILSTAGLRPAPELVAACDAAGVPLLLTLTSTGTAIAKITARLEDHLAERITVHGTLVDLLGLGVLILGESGIGKSECALDLIARGHRLVADDVVDVRRRAESTLEGSAPETARFFMEVRGVGLIDVQALYGVSATCIAKTIGLVVQLERWDVTREYERLGLDDHTHELLERARAAGQDARRSRAQHRDAGGRRGPQRVAQGSWLQPGARAHRAAGPTPARRDAAAGDRAMTAARRRRPETPRGRFIVVTGLSGAGKSQAIRALEDLGYFCVDNLPTQLIPTLANLSKRGSADLPKVALVIDVREGSFLREFPRVWKRLKATPGLDPLLVFLEASHDTLVRRFSETRRPHPLAHGRSVVEGLRAERRQMQKIRELADDIVDTTHLTVHQLRERFLGFSEARSTRQKLLVTLLSFGFKHGLPVDADLVFDVRFLPNPHFVDRLRPQTGRDPAVVRFLRASAADWRVSRATERSVVVPGAAVRARRQELPDHRHRLHRRAPSLGDGGRGADAGVAQGGGRAACRCVTAMWSRR